MARPENPQENPQYIKERYGLDVSLMDRMVEYLRASGDASAISFLKLVEVPNTLPHCALYLRYDLKKRSNTVGALGTVWESKGIAIESGGKPPVINIMFTGNTRDLVRRPRDLVRSLGREDGWTNLEEVHLFKIFEFGLNEIREARRDSPELFTVRDELSIEEKVNVARIFAVHRPDYRFGLGNASGVESKINKSLLPPAV